MAETLGVAASGITVAQISMQVGGTVLKLKKLWDEIKAVPDDIADLMEQIECLSPILCETENGFNQSGLPPISWDELASRPTSMYCRKALQNLTVMVDELSYQINSAKKRHRKIAAVKVVLKKDLLRKLERRLESAVRMLTLAQQSYLVALTRVQPDIIIERFTALTLRGNQAELQVAYNQRSEKEDKEEPTRTPDKSSKSTQARWRTRFFKPGLFGRLLVDSFESGHAVLLQAPIWLSRRSWELHSIKANGSWQYNIRSYSIVPHKSKVIQLAMTGSVHDMQKLFDTGLASLYDRHPLGLTLLSPAAAGGNFEMIKFLLSAGLSAWDSNQTLFGYPAQWLCNSTEYKSVVYQLLSETTLAKEFFIFPESKSPEYEDSHNLPHVCHCEGFLYDKEIYKALLPYQCPLHQNIPLVRRLDAAIHALRFKKCCTEVVKLMLEPEWSTNPQAIFRNADTCMSIAIGAAIQLLLSVYNTKRTQKTSGAFSRSWFAFAVDVIKQTTDFHAVEVDLNTRLFPKERTALFAMLSKAAVSARHYPPPRFFKDMAFALRLWLQVLMQAGVDLDTYGKREREWFINNDRYHYFAPYGKHRFFFGYYLANFKFGPKPEDWELYWAERTDVFAGDFWKLTEEPQLHIPGAWVD